MQTPNRALSGIELPRVLIYAVALTCGVLTALAVQICLSRAGYDPVAKWQDLFAAKGLQLRAAGPWWAIAGAAFIASGASAAALSRLPLPWRRLRALRWTLAAASVFGLAHIGHWAAALPNASTPAGASVAASLAVLFIAALMSLLGAYFTARG